MTTLRMKEDLNWQEDPWKYMRTQSQVAPSNIWPVPPIPERCLGPWEASRFVECFWFKKTWSYRATRACALLEQQGCSSISSVSKNEATRAHAWSSTRHWVSIPNQPDESSYSLHFRKTIRPCLDFTFFKGIKHKLLAISSNMVIQSREYTDKMAALLKVKTIKTVFIFFKKSLFLSVHLVNFDKCMQSCDCYHHITLSIRHITRPHHLWLKIFFILVSCINRICI